MRDARLDDGAWRLRTGFDNIDPKPKSDGDGRKKYKRSDEKSISQQIDSEVFGRN